MKIARFRQPALSALAVLLISGAGIAFAGNSSSSGPVVPAAGSTTQPTTQPTTEPVEPAGADTDTLQEGDQTTPDSAADPTGTGTETAGTETEAAGTETEAAGVEEPGDASLPGGGHADDPNDPNADHQFEGVE
jgi:hypothetical protein